MLRHYNPVRLFLVSFALGFGVCFAGMNGHLAQLGDMLFGPNPAQSSAERYKK